MTRGDVAKIRSGRKFGGEQLCWTIMVDRLMSRNVTCNDQHVGMLVCLLIIDDLVGERERKRDVNGGCNIRLGGKSKREEK